MDISRAIAADSEQITNTERLVTSALSIPVKTYLPAVGDGTGATVAADFTTDVYSTGTQPVEVVDAVGRRVGLVPAGTGLTFQAAGNAASPRWFTVPIQKVQQKEVSPPVVITYAATMATDCNLGSIFTITATDTVAMTISNPTNPLVGQLLSYVLKNASGGVMGTITWGAAFKVVAITKPATGFNRTISFVYDGTNWVELSFGAIDIPN